MNSTPLLSPEEHSCSRSANLSKGTTRFPTHFIQEFAMRRSDIFKYFVCEYFNEDLALVAKTTGYTPQQVKEWWNGIRQPQRRTLEYVMHCAVAPEFKIIVEFAPFSPEREIRQQLRQALAGHESRSGIYAFYDSLANLLYVGKATNLLEEIYSALRRGIPVEFPRGVEKQPQRRFEVVKYISAYEVGGLEWADYPKHAESFLLRISKPPLNRNIGHLFRIDPDDGC